MVLKKTPHMPVACERHGLLLAIHHVTTSDIVTGGRGSCYGSKV